MNHKDTDCICMKFIAKILHKIIFFVMVYHIKYFASNASKITKNKIQYLKKNYMKTYTIYAIFIFFRICVNYFTIP